MTKKDPQTSVEELQDVMEMISDTFYTCLSFNRDKAIGLVTESGMTDANKDLIAKSVNAGVRATLSTVEELNGEIRFKTRGVTAILAGDLVRRMFDGINS
ncbi:hypothetical protein D3C75_829300 [compost metagenome]